MALSSCSSVSVSFSSANFNKLLQLGKLHPYLTTLDISRTSHINRLAYSYLCCHLHGQHNIFNVRRRLGFCPTLQTSLMEIINRSKATFSQGATPIEIELDRKSYSVIVYKNKEIVEAFVYVPTTHEMIGGYKTLDYYFDLTSGKLFVLAFGKRAFITAREIALMQRFKDDPQFSRLSTFHRMFTLKDKGVAFMIPFCNGGDLKAFLQARLRLPTKLQKKWSTLFGLELCKGVALSLAQLHRNGLIHCDVKLENVLLNFNGCQLEVKLTDFGGTVASGSDRVESTIPYAPPEVCRILLSDERAKAHFGYDTYSLGLVCFMSLTQYFLPFIYDQMSYNSRKSPHENKIAALKFVASLYANREWTRQIFASPSNPFGLTPGSSISNLVRDMIGPDSRMSIEEVIEQIKTIMLEHHYMCRTVV